jgi:hypothetical protein
MIKTPEAMKNETILALDNHEIKSKEIIDILRRQGNMQPLITELILERALSEVELSSEEESQELQKFRENNNLESEEAYVDYLQANHLNEGLLLQIVTRPTRVIRYREDRWGPRANSLYLKHKEQYDLITYKRLQCKDQDVMQEIYFRLKDNEESWESLAAQLTGGAASSATIGPVPVANLEGSLLTAMRHFGPRHVCKPISLDSQVVVAELVQFNPSEFNDELRTDILRREFEAWLMEESKKMMNKVTYSS